MCNIYFWQSTGSIRCRPAVSLSFCSCSINRPSKFFPTTVFTAQKALFWMKPTEKHFVLFKDKITMCNLFSLQKLWSRKLFVWNIALHLQAIDAMNLCITTQKLCTSMVISKTFLFEEKTRLVSITGLCRRTYLTIFPFTVLYFLHYTSY